MEFDKEQLIKRQKINDLMRECIDDAKNIVQEKRLLESQLNIIQVAVALFQERNKK